jgi:hypothetical protein
MASPSEIRRKLCFVIGPIGDEDSEHRIHADWLYTGIILPVFEKHFEDFSVERADKIPTPGMVSSQIINRLHEAELVIADLSFHNANAFYEMSIRHGVAKPIIHMIRKGERIPFDVIPHRAIPFLNTKPEEQAKARELLIPAVQAAVQDGFEADNPIKHARGRLEADRSADPATRVISEELASLRARIDNIENGDRPSGVLRIGLKKSKYASVATGARFYLLIDPRKNPLVVREALELAQKLGHIEDMVEGMDVLSFTIHSMGVPFSEAVSGFKKIVGVNRIDVS